MTSRCCWLIQAARATRTNCSGCDSDGTAASLSEAEFLEASDRRSEVDRVFGHYAVLFLKIVDDIALLLVEPAGVRDQDELQGMRLRRHGNSLSEAEFTRSLGRPFGVDPVFGQTRTRSYSGLRALNAVAREEYVTLPSPAAGSAVRKLSRNRS